jgi:AGZA family xanthine/uracil permease-like MFS transporter
MSIPSQSSSSNGRAQPLFVAGDIDGFFGLAIDNLIQFIVIVALCTSPFILGFSNEMLLETILPGAGLSILVGNLFYAWQAQKLSAATGRTDVTALPYGINTVSLFAFVFFVMAPVKAALVKAGASPEEAAKGAWQIGLAACLVSGAIELVGSLVAEKIRQFTPRAALLSSLAGIAISFIAIDFAVRTFEAPLLAMLPLAVVLTTYFSGIKMPFRIPGGAWAIGLGTAAAWILFYVDPSSSPVSSGGLSEAVDTVGVYLPIPVLGDVVAGLSHPLFIDFLIPVVLPMGLFNVLGSLQNVESAEAAGDSYKTMPSLAVNGAGTMIAALFGSCFPTTIYIGHPGWKGLGARSGYSILNGIFFLIMSFLGLSIFLSALIPIEAGMAIVLWIGVVMTAQAFQSTPKAHAPAVAMGLFPGIAAWGLLMIQLTLGAAGIAASDPELGSKALANPAAWKTVGIHLDGMVAISQGFLITCMVWAAASAYLIDKAFDKAAIWMFIGAVIAFFGFIHTGSMTPAGAVYDIGFGTGWTWALGYTLSGFFFVFMSFWAKKAGPAIEHA